MINLSSDIKSMAIFSDDEMKEYRYLLTREWDNSKKRAAVIMLNPSKATHLKFDNTIMNIHNFILDYESEAYGSYSIGNLFSYRSTESKQIVNRNQQYEDENEYYLSELFKKSDIIIVAWGRDFKKTNAVTQRDINKQIANILEIMEDYRDKIFIFWDGKEEVINLKPRHPVFLKSYWKLVKYEF